ncbi:unnamed protein product, partial [Cladocopium goreaui]
KEKDELAGKFRFGKTILITDLNYKCQANSGGTTNIQYGLDEMGYVVTVIDINSFKSVTRAQKFLDAVEHLIKSVMPNIIVEENVTIHFWISFAFLITDTHPYHVWVERNYAERLAEAIRRVDKLATRPIFVSLCKDPRFHGIRSGIQDIAIDSADILRSFGIMVTTDDGMWRCEHGEILMKALSHFGMVRVPRDRVKQIFVGKRGRQYGVIREEFTLGEGNDAHERFAYRADPGELLAGLEASINIFHGTTRSTTTPNTKRGGSRITEPTNYEETLVNQILRTIDVVRRSLEATANPDGQTQVGLVFAADYCVLSLEMSLKEEEDEEDDSDPDFDLFDFDDTQVKRCPLWLAAKYGHDEVIRLLLHAKADKERVAPDGSTALIAACSAGPHTTAAVATLLAAKAHFETSDDAGMTVLGYAARAGFPEAVRQLLEAKAMQVWDGKGRTPLLWCAAEKGSRFVEVAKLLLQHAAEVNATSDHGSPLTSAVPSADAGMTCALLEARAKVNQPDQFSQSALWLACRYGRKDLLDPLLTARADVEQTDAHQVSPVECCALFAEDVEMVKQLVQLGASTEKLLDQWEEMRQMACCDDEDLEDVTEYIEVLRAAKIFVGLMVNPPQLGDPSYELFQKETSGIFESLKRRALRLTDALNKVPGISCQPIDGAMYAFPSVKLPPKAIEDAKQKDQEPDGLWCLELLEKTGIVTVPGSGFGQMDGSFHFRTTILPPDELLEEVVKKLMVFQEDFMNKYGECNGSGGY